MFLGHFALGLGAKRLEPSLSLGSTFAAAQLPDLVWPALVLAGVERVAIAPGDTAFTPLRFLSYPYSHSLLALVLWGAALAALHYRSQRRLRAAVVLGLLVLSHWLLDLLTHRADLPLVPWGGPRLGLGLWESVPATLGLELAMYGAGLVLYSRASVARDGRGRYGFGALAGLLVVVYFASAFGPPPPSATAVGLAGLVGGALFWAWAVWADRHREPRAAA